MTRTEVRPGGETGAMEVGETSTASIAGRSDPPTVPGLVYGPHRGRTHHLILVRCCPHCRAAHRHVTAWLAATHRRSCPVTGRAVIIVTTVDRDTSRGVARAA